MASPTMDAPTAGAACGDPDCATPVEPVDELPPPICTAPVEPDAVLLPSPPIVMGALAPAVFPDAPAEADGEAVTELTCTLPVEPLEVFPPPAWTAPTEFVAVLSPDPPIVTGTEAVAVVPACVASAVGVASTGPVCTAPIEPVALLSASAFCAVPNVSANTTATTSMHLDLMSPSFVDISRVDPFIWQHLRQITRTRDRT